MKPASTQEDPFSDEFHRLLGRLIHSIARFDFTVGLQLNWLGPHCQQVACRDGSALSLIQQSLQAES